MRVLLVLMWMWMCVDIYFYPLHKNKIWILIRIRSKNMKLRNYVSNCPQLKNSTCFLLRRQDEIVKIPVNCFSVETAPSIWQTNEFQWCSHSKEKRCRKKKKPLTWIQVKSWFIYMLCPLRYGSKLVFWHISLWHNDPFVYSNRA